MNVRLFGMTRDGREVQAVRLSAGELTATLLTFGATLQDLRLAGTPWPLTLGSDELAAYEVGGPCRWMGSIVGPVANRIADSRAELGGEALVFHANEGPTLLHSGDSGTDQQVWTIDEASRDACTLSLALPHGFGGFPGQRRFTARFALTGPATLHLTLTATTDRPTFVNLANHSYWTLDGTPDVSAHQLSVAAGHYLPTDALGLPENPTPVTGTPFDWRTPRPLGPAPGLDHCFCREPDVTPTHAARLTGAKGVRLDLATTAPGLQVYDGRGIGTAPVIGLTGAPYGPHAGLALEPQLWPNGPNRPDFPSVTVQPGEIRRQVSLWSFSRADGA